MDRDSPGPRYQSAEHFQQSHIAHLNHTRRLATDYPDPAGADAPRWPGGLHECSKGPRTRSREKWIPEENHRRELQAKKLGRRGGDFLIGPYDSVGKQVQSIHATPGKTCMTVRPDVNPLPRQSNDLGPGGFHVGKEVGTAGPRYQSADGFIRSTQLTHNQSKRRAEYYPQPAGADPTRWPRGLHECSKGPRTRSREKWIPEEYDRHRLEQARNNRRGGDFLIGPYDSVGKQVQSIHATPGKTCMTVRPDVNPLPHQSSNVGPALVNLFQGPNPSIGPRMDPAGPPPQVKHTFSKTIPKCSDRLDASVEFEQVSLYTEQLRAEEAERRAEGKKHGYGVPKDELSDPKPFQRGDALKEWFALNGSPSGKISSKAWGRGGSNRLRGTARG